MDIHEENEDQLQELEPLSSDPQSAAEPEQDQPEDQAVDPAPSPADPQEQDPAAEEDEAGDGEAEDAEEREPEAPVLESAPQEFLDDLPILEPEADVEPVEEMVEELDEPDIEELDEPEVEEFVELEVEDPVELEDEETFESEVQDPVKPVMENFGIVDEDYLEVEGSESKDKDHDPYASVTVPEDTAVKDGRAWYVIHCYSGNEDKVRHNIMQRIESMGMDNLIFDVVVPTEDEVNIKNGERQTVEKKVFPGYILVYMVLTEESWYMVRNTPGVTGFVGMGNDPTALQPEEVARILKRMESESPRINVTFRPGERVRIVDGPFEDFYGKVSEIDMERATVRVMVNFFGRETPVELDFLQVEEA